MPVVVLMGRSRFVSAVIKYNVKKYCLSGWNPPLMGRALRRRVYISFTNLVINSVSA